MGFGSVQIVQNCNGNYDVEKDGRIDREIMNPNDLSILEDLSIEGDRFCFFISNFPGNIIGNGVDKIRNSNFCRRIRDEIDHINGM